MDQAFGADGENNQAISDNVGAVMNELNLRRTDAVAARTALQATLLGTGLGPRSRPAVRRPTPHRHRSGRLAIIPLSTPLRITPCSISCAISPSMSPTALERSTS
jgi:hypothetical protein